MTEIESVKTKGTLTDTGDPMSREMVITIGGIESMKEEKAILKGLKSLLLEVSGQSELS